MPSSAIRDRFRIMFRLFMVYVVYVLISVALQDADVEVEVEVEVERKERGTGRGGGIDGPHTPSVRDQRLACGRAMHAGCLTEMRRRGAAARCPLCRAAHPKQWLPVVVGYPPGCLACAFFKERISKTR